MSQGVGRESCLPKTAWPPTSVPKGSTAKVAAPGTRPFRTPFTVPSPPPTMMKGARLSELMRRVIAVASSRFRVRYRRWLIPDDSRKDLTDSVFSAEYDPDKRFIMSEQSSGNFPSGNLIDDKYFAFPGLNHEGLSM